MACATLKRHLDWEAPSSKRARLCEGPTSSRYLNPSPFTDNVVPTLTPDQMATSIREEIRRMHKRKQLNYVFPDEENTMNGHYSFKRGAERMSQDSSSDSSGAESPTPIDGIDAHMHHRRPNRQRSSKPERALFTFAQMNMICDRMIRERETQLREQYDQILYEKLSEQYDAFVKFTCDQLQRHVAPTQSSYLS